MHVQARALTAKTCRNVRVLWSPRATRSMRDPHDKLWAPRGLGSLARLSQCDPVAMLRADVYGTALHSNHAVYMEMVS